MSALEIAAAVASECVLIEMERAMLKFATWPTDPLHALAVLGEEVGEINEAFGRLTKATLQHTYEPHKAALADVREEATQTGAMVLRFLMSLDRYEFAGSAQHTQGPTA
jgi:NTP pyrophosphatase (non-canonical NTP hydrolase)